MIYHDKHTNTTQV